MTKYSPLLEDLVLLSTHRYRQVRKKGQKAFSSMFKHYNITQKAKFASSILASLHSKGMSVAILSFISLTNSPPPQQSTQQIKIIRLLH